jgi:glycosyltransferase involved in cell wall biosynthesis
MSRWLKQAQVEISVIISTYRQQEILPLILQSLSRQDCATCFEVLVCDDGSEDAAAVLRSRDDGLDLRYIWQPDIGYRLARSRNNGIRCAQGNLLLFLDGDMLPDESLLSKHAAAHRQYRGRTVIAGLSRNVSVDIGAWARLPWQEAMGYCVLHGKPGHRARQLELASGALPWLGCWGGHFSVRRTEQVVYDEELVGFGHEDYELFCRLYHRYNFAMRVREDIETYHISSNDSPPSWNPWRAERQDAIERMVRNCLYVQDKFPNIDLAEAMWPLRHFVWDQESGRWRKAQRTELLDLQNAIEQARAWRSRMSADPSTQEEH